MELLDNIKVFLRWNSDLVKNREWDKLFEEWRKYIKKQWNPHLHLDTRYLSHFLISCAGMALTQLKVIYPYMFEVDQTIQSVHIPSNIEKICYRAFYGSTLSDIRIDDGLQIVETDAISSTKIKKIKLPKSLKKIDRWSIAFNSNLEEVWIQGNPFIAQETFQECPKLSKIFLVGATSLQKEDLALNLILPNKSFDVEKDIVIV